MGEYKFVKDLSMGEEKICKKLLWGSTNIIHDVNYMVALEPANKFYVMYIMTTVAFVDAHTLFYKNEMYKNV